jgi:hypothetical protein
LSLGLRISACRRASLSLASLVQEWALLQVIESENETGCVAEQGFQAL